MFQPSPAIPCLLTTEVDKAMIPPNERKRSVVGRPQARWENPMVQCWDGINVSDVAVAEDLTDWMSAVAKYDLFRAFQHLDISRA